MNQLYTEKSRKGRIRGVRTLRARVERGAPAGSAHSDDEPTLTVGAAAGNDLVVDHPTVSRFHMELRSTLRGVRVTDLESTNGTWHRGARLERAFVPPGTELRIGDVHIVVEDGERASMPDYDSGLPGIVSESGAMQRVASRVRRLANSDLAVWLHGETGTGKELVARAIHDLSPRRERPFVTLDCGALPAMLAASILFGHERGAFTGAERRSIGAFRRADGGTLFLDEIGELADEVQPILLRALQEKTVCRVGGTEQEPVDVRVVVATHRDLRADVNVGRFRPDLYYRVAGTRVEIPPLRERPEDIPALIARFVAEHAPERVRVFGPHALKRLAARRWNGNVRELKNYVEAALALGGLLERPEEPLPPFKEAKGQAIERFEREYFTRLIERTDGNASAAARLAQMDRPYLLTRLRKHGLR